MVTRVEQTLLHVDFSHKLVPKRVELWPSPRKSQQRQTLPQAPSLISLSRKFYEIEMQENFRQFLDRLRQNGELVDLHQPVDIRHIATLVDQAKTALFFHNVIGYDMPVISGLIRSRERAAMSLGCETYREIEDKLAQAIARPISPEYVETSPTHELTLVGDDVDLFKLPIPMSSIYDGGPMITAGVVIACDP